MRVPDFRSILHLATRTLTRGTCSKFSPAAQGALPRRTLWASAASSTQSEIEEIRARIFGTRIGNGLRSGAKVLRKKLVGEKIANYYLTPIARSDPMFVSLTAEAKKAKLEKLKRRGKAPPPKGQGKRSAGGKKR